MRECDPISQPASESSRSSSHESGTSSEEYGLSTQFVDARPGHPLGADECRRGEHRPGHSEAVENGTRELENGPEGVVEGDGDEPPRVGAGHGLRESHAPVAALGEVLELAFEFARGDGEVGRPALADGVITEDENVAHAAVTREEALWPPSRGRTRLRPRRESLLPGACET